MDVSNRLKKAGNRIGGDLHHLIEALPGYAAVALGLNYRDSDAVDIAATDGRTIFAGPAFPDFTPPQRRFVLCHELLHVVLGHIPRTRLLQRLDPEGFNPELANIVQDALINTALVAEHRQGDKHWRWIQVPDHAIRLGPILKALGDLKEEADPDADLALCGEYSFEDLYFRLKKAGRTGWSTMLEGDVVFEPGGAGKDVPMTDEALREQIRQACEHQSLLQGALKGAVQRLVNEYPKVETPWEKVLVGWLTRKIRGNRSPDFSRPSRRFSALEGECSKQGINLPFEPARSLRRTGRLAIAVDTSGSVSEEVLKVFFGHLAAILRQWKPDVLILAADAAVHETYELKGKKALDRLRQVVLSGGGGTDFRPAIARAAEFGPDCMVYLTDLMGQFGEEPAFPVLWAVLPGFPGQPPWGRALTLK